MRAAHQQASNGWANWSTNQQAHPAKLAHPRSEDALRKLLREAPRPVRVVGAGHSFTPIVPTSGTIISLDKMTGVIAADRAAGTARIRMGTRLAALSAALEDHGLAFHNLGDINVQSFAGAAATATHGTGETLPCLAAGIRELRVMLGSGDIIEATYETYPELVRALQVSLGALGILLEATVSVAPAYRLHRRTWVEPIDSILASAAARWAHHRNYEFFYLPFSGYGINISHDLTTAAETPRRPGTDEADLRNLRRLRSLLKWCPPLRRLCLSAALRGFKPEDTVGTSWQLLASERETRFNEMEYHLPVATAFDAFCEVRAWVERYRPEVFFPIEVRKTAADDAWLSPFNDGPRISIALHAHAPDACDWFFDAPERILREAGGRPHWGKLHSLTAAELAELYPAFTRFTALRREYDPSGVFLTPALARLWGASG